MRGKQGRGDRGRKNSEAAQLPPHTAEKPRELRSSFLGALLQGAGSGTSEVAHSSPQPLGRERRVSTWAPAGSGQRLHTCALVTKTVLTSKISTRSLPGTPKTQKGATQEASMPITLQPRNIFCKCLVYCFPILSLSLCKYFNQSCLFLSPVFFLFHVSRHG